MKLIPRVTRGITTRTKLICADNSGAKILKVVGVVGYKGVRRRYPRAGVGDMIFTSILAGPLELKGKIAKSIVVRQRQWYKRPDGTRVRFEDNAAILVDDDGNPKGTEIRGPVAKETIQKWTAIGKIARIIA